MNAVDPKALVLGQGLQAYRDDFEVYLRLIPGHQVENAIDLDEWQAWKLLQVLLADVERLAEAVYAMEGVRYTKPHFRCLAEGCLNRTTEDTGWQGYCAVHRDLA